MLRYVIKRIILLVIALFAIITISFFLMELIPGYPKALEATLLDPHLTSQEKQELLAPFNENPFVSYGKYISGIFHGDFGTDYSMPTMPIPTYFIQGMKYTMMVSIPAFIVGTIVGIAFGFISGYNRGKLPDIVVNIIAVFFVSIPTFITAIALVLVADSTGFPFRFAGVDASFWVQMKSLVLPISVMTLTSFATLTYYVRNEVVEVLSSDYITIARAKGVSEKRLLFKHVMRNASIPMITIILPSFVFLITGSMVMEMYFGVPGSATHITNAVSNNEMYVVMFSVVFFTFLSLSTSLVTDIIYVLLDPRIRLAEKNKKTILNKIIPAYQRRINFRKEVSNVK